MTYGREKSDPSIVAVKLANKTGQPEAESVERREGAEGNTEGQHMRRTQSRESVSQGLDGVQPLPAWFTSSGVFFFFGAQSCPSNTWSISR
jgi:hypothetical protein